MNKEHDFIINYYLPEFAFGSCLNMLFLNVKGYSYHYTNFAYTTIDVGPILIIRLLSVIELFIVLWSQ